MENMGITHFGTRIEKKKIKEKTRGFRSHVGNLSQKLLRLKLK